MVRIFNSPHVGFFSIDKNLEDESKQLVVNLGCIFFNVIGCIPIVGCIIGFSRIYVGMHSSWKHLLIAVVRGLCEVLALGIIFIVLDLIVSLCVFMYYKLQQYTSSDTVPWIASCLM